MESLLKQFEAKAPEIVFEWNDAPTGAQGWMVINSLRGGAAGGGTRMRIGLDKNEVLSLAKTMEIKFAVAGPAIGGAKSGINFDPADPRKLEVLDRWYKALMPILKSYYGTGGDLNIDEIREVIPITEKYGLEHPQEGVFVGHFKPDAAARKKIIQQLREGVSKVLSDPFYSPDVSRGYVVADMITGWGVSEALKSYYQLWHEGASLKGKRVIIQGWGNVAAAAAYYLAQEEAVIVGIIDRVGGLISDTGLGFEEIRTLFNTKDHNALASADMMSYKEVNRKIWDIPADIFVPAAASRLLGPDEMSRMSVGGVQAVSCGANVPFADKEIFYGPRAEYADHHFSILPDFIANCGMARTFAYLMQPDVSLADADIFGDVSRTIHTALEDIHSIHPDKKLMLKASFEHIVSKLS